MNNPIVTILIPNYRTPELTKLCLRLIRKHTDCSRIHVIVIDNDSGDESTDYLKSLKWIELIQREPIPCESPSVSHSRALDLALERVTTPYVLSIHTDTFIKDPGWLDALLNEIEKGPEIAGIGSWKLENSPSFLKRAWKIFEYKVRRLKYSISSNQEKFVEVKSQEDAGYYSLSNPNSLNLNKKNYYLRSHCALYRTDILKEHGLKFHTPDKTAGHEMHHRLTEKNYKMVFLSTEFLSRYLMHLNHATMVLHPELGSRKKTVRKGMKRIKKALKVLKADEIMKENSLDL